MVKFVNEEIIDISGHMNRLLAEIDQKIGSKLLSELNNDFDRKHYPISIQRSEIAILLEGIDSRLRHIHSLKLQFFDTLEHDFIIGASSFSKYGVKCTFILPGTIIQKEFQVIDQTGYADVVHAAFRDFILTASSLLENLVRLSETLVRKVIVNSPKKAPQAGSETLQLYREFLEILIKLEYRDKDDLHSCLLAYNVFFEKYLAPLYRLRGSFIHGYHENLIVDVQNGYLVRQIDESFKQLSNTELMLDQFAEHVFGNLSGFTIDLLGCLTKKIADPSVKIPV